MYLLAKQQDEQLGVIPIPPPLKYANLYKFLTEISIKPVEPAAPAPAAGTVEHLSSQQEFETACVQAGGLCAVALLDGSDVSQPGLSPP